jgi:hypothetical protein
MPVMSGCYFDADLWKIFAELSYFYRQICAKQVSKTIMQKLEKEIMVLVCKMKKILPPEWFNAMQHLLVHLPWEASVGGPAQFRWVYSQERELKKLRVTMRNKARVEGCIVEEFTCKDTTNLSSKYFSCTKNVNAHITRYHMVEEVLLSELSIFQWKGKVVGAPSAHYVTDNKWNYTMLYMYTNMEEVQIYFNMFDKTYWKRSGQPTLKKLDSMRQHEVKDGPSILQWFRLHESFCFTHFSFLIVVHLSHASNCRSSIAPIYEVYVGCQCV